MANAVPPDALATNLTAYPVFASKSAFITAWRQAMEHDNKSQMYELMNRFSNTDSSTWADPTGRHD